MADQTTSYYSLGMGNYEAWVATLGPSSEIQYDPVTGKEDFTGLRKVKAYFANWNPSQTWTPQPICVHEEDVGRKLSFADRISYRAVGPIISENAVKKMRPLLEREGHILLLDVRNRDEKFYFWWVPWVKDSVDFERSEKHLRGLSYKKPAINHYNIKGLTAFRPHFEDMYNPEGQGDVLVSDEFRMKWLEEGLTGIEFKPTI